MTVYILVVEERHDPAENGMGHGHHLKFYGPFFDHDRALLFMEWAANNLPTAVGGRIVELVPEPVAFVLSAPPIDPPTL